MKKRKIYSLIAVSVILCMTLCGCTKKEKEAKAPTKPAIITLPMKATDSFNPLMSRFLLKMKKWK